MIWKKNTTENKDGSGKQNRVQKPKKKIPTKQGPNNNKNTTQYSYFPKSINRWIIGDILNINKVNKSSKMNNHVFF